jgi:apolipoprotein N-acyltransferase
MSNSRAPTFLALLIAGALLPLALAPFSLWPIAIVSSAVLFWFLQNNSPKQTLINATVFGFGLFFAGVSWVYISMHDHGEVAAPLALLGTILFCLFLAILFAVPFILSAFIPQTPIALSIGLPAIWVLSEWFRSWVFTGFPWLYAGYAYTDTWLNGWAPIGGVLWLSYINALAAAAVVQLLRKPHRRAQLVTAMVVTLWVMGYGLQKVDWTQSSGTELSVVLVQPNVNQEDKWSPAERDNILQRLASQTEAHWGADIILWPEGAIPALPRQVAD